MSRISTNGSSTSKFIILNTPELLTVDRPSLLLSNEDANNIKKLYYDGGYSKMHVHYGGEYTANSGLNIPISIYSPYFLDNDIQVGSWMKLSWINPDDPSSICSMTLTVQNDYSIEAGIPTETKLALKSDLSLYALADLSNVMTVSLGQNGYAKFNNGLLIQWGYFSAGASNNQSINFPVSFKSCFSLAFSSSTDNTDNSIWSVNYAAIYASYFTVYRRYANAGGVSPSSQSFRWIAIGSWK